jgi:hypothetical protein
LLGFWQLIGFEDALDAWISHENPSVDLRFLVTEWVVGRADDPYIGVTRRLEIASNYWFGVVPGSRDDDRVVTCAYWIDEPTRSVRCDIIASLRPPIL